MACYKWAESGGIVGRTLEEVECHGYNGYPDPLVVYRLCNDPRQSPMHPLYHPIALRMVGGCSDVSNATVFHPLLKAMGNKLGTIVIHYGYRETTSGKKRCKLVNQYSVCRFSERDGFRPPGGHVI